nr:MAG TPA: hypothetical protein [Caudoviricetes sp.]
MSPSAFFRNSVLQHSEKVHLWMCRCVVSILARS